MEFHNYNFRNGMHHQPTLLRHIKLTDHSYNIRPTEGHAVWPKYSI